MLYTASYYDPNYWQGQAYRISRAHPRGQVTNWDVQPFFYPSRNILNQYRDGKLDFDSFSAEYRIELQTNYDWESDFQDWLGLLKPEKDFTLLGFEPAGEPCHRRVAAEWLLEIMPELGPGQIR